MEDLQEQINSLTSNKDARYFYHFTSFDANEILENGLVVASPRWDESFLEFTISELNIIDNVIEDNKSTRVKDNAYMIIAGVYKDNMDSFIRKLGEEEFAGINYEGVAAPDYIVDTPHLMGYIDLSTRKLVINEFANVIGEDFYL